MRARSLGSLAVGLFIIPTLVASQAQQVVPVPPRDRPVAAEAPTGTARIRGRIVAADSGGPLRRAQVRAVAGAIRTTRLTSTDVEGRYEFVDLPAGRYDITVNKTGYVGLAFGQKRPFDGGRPMDVADAQVIEGIDFALPRGSVIAGRITDDAGDPLVGAYVQAMRYQYQAGGRRQLVAAGSRFFFSNMTNDLGEFRLFGLMPGTYVVLANSTSTGVVSLTQSGPGTGGIGAIDVRDGFIRTYYPGVANIAEAQPVVVTLGEEAQASFSMVTGRMSKLSGTVRRSDGRPPVAGSRVQLRPNEASGPGLGAWGSSPIAPDGSFSFANVPPGSHVLEVTPNRQMPGPEGAQPGQEFGVVPISVGGSDMAGLSIVTRPGATASGRVIIAGKGTKNADGSPMRIAAVPADPTRGPNMPFLSNSGSIDEAGRFQIRDVIGQVLFRMQSLPPDLILKSVSVNGSDITDKPYDATNGNLANLEIVLAEPAQISGTAQDAGGVPVRDYKVALFPAGVKPSTLTSRFMRASTADPSGRYEVSGLAAGDYLGVAVESFEQGEEWDPAFQQRVLPAARRFSVKEGQRVNVELPYVK